MTTIIAVTQIKGGVGKTVISMNLAQTLKASGYKVALLDVENKSRAATKWGTVAHRTHGQPIDVVTVSRRSSDLAADLRRQAQPYDAVVIDTPPEASEETRAAMMAADTVVIPVCPGPTDVWGFDETLQLYLEALEVRPQLRATVVLNRARRGTHGSLSRIVADMLPEKLAAAHVPETPIAELHDLVAFPMAVANGRSVLDYAPKSEAAREMHQLTSTVVNTLVSHVQAS